MTMFSQISRFVAFILDGRSHLARIFSVGFDADALFDGYTSFNRHPDVLGLNFSIEGLLKVLRVLTYCGPDEDTFPRRSCLLLPLLPLFRIFGRFRSVDRSVWGGGISRVRGSTRSRHLCVCPLHRFAVTSDRCEVAVTFVCRGRRGC
uniref:Uncharacterized protein n=1 Tax=Cacopsylla melanoneura TaxID=428564 RepID=A0A8D8UP74_9HEMI